MVAAAERQGDSFRIASAPVLPEGFSLKGYPSGHSDYMTNFVMLPGPQVHFITLGKGGDVRYTAPDGTSRLLARVPNVHSLNDIGLIGIDLAPDYAASGRFYLVYTHSPDRPMGRVQRWRVDSPVSPRFAEAETVLLDGVSQIGIDSHGPGDVCVARDGTLFVTMGDAALFSTVDPKAAWTGNIDDPHGKVLRMNPDGTGVSSNPYYDPSRPHETRSLVYASEVRNMFRIDCRSLPGQVIGGDVGWRAWEEINAFGPGARLGWPCWEGFSQAGGYRDLDYCKARYGSGFTGPYRTYNRVGTGGAVVGGVCLSGTRYPAAYQGLCLGGDYAQSRFFTFPKPGAVPSGPVAPDTFGSDIGGPVAFRHGPNGHVFFADIYTGRVMELVYGAGNRPPNASLSVPVDPATRSARFDASRSHDPDGDVLSYRLEPGDGSAAIVSRSPHIDYTYPREGTFEAALTVTDPFGAAARATERVSVSGAAPVLSFGPEVDPTRTYVVGDVATLSASARDASGVDISYQIVWRDKKQHCYGPDVCHPHDNQAGTGPSVRVPISDHGGDTRTVVEASVRDAEGRTSTLVYPVRTKMRVIEVVSPAPVTINGRELTSQRVVVGSRNTVSVPQEFTGRQFVAWSDGSTDRVRVFTMPDADVNLSALYRAEPAPLSPIEAKAWELPWIGAPLGPEGEVAGGLMRDYENATILWSAATAAHEVHGSIREEFRRAGGAAVVGLPVTDELPTADSKGRYNDFLGGRSISWSPATGAHYVYGSIWAEWSRVGREAGFLRFPLTTELPLGRGRVTRFEGGSLYWTPSTGAHEVHGAIGARYRDRDLGEDRYGFPVTNESVTPDRIGRYNHFEGDRSIYWSPRTGAHEVYGAIRAEWARRGWETGRLGYPTSGEYPVPGGRRSDFQGGSITWDRTTGAVEVTHR